MSSLRLALKLSRQENSSSAAENGDFNDEYYQSLLKINSRKKRKRASSDYSIDNKRMSMNDDNTNISSNISVYDELTDKSINIFDEIKENNDIKNMNLEDADITMDDSTSDRIFEKSNNDLDESVSSTNKDDDVDGEDTTNNKNTIIDDDLYFNKPSKEIIERSENEIVSNNNQSKSIDENDDGDNEEGDDNQSNASDSIEDDESSDDNDDESDDNSDTNEPSFKLSSKSSDSVDTSADSANDKSINAATTENKSGEPVKVRRKGKRKSGILRSLGLSNGEGDDTFNLLPSRAAAMLAKTKLAIQPLRKHKSNHSSSTNNNIAVVEKVEKIDLRRKQHRMERMARLKLLEGKTANSMKTESVNKPEVKIDGRSKESRMAKMAKLLSEKQKNNNLENKLESKAEIIVERKEDNISDNNEETKESNSKEESAENTLEAKLEIKAENKGDSKASDTTERIESSDYPWVQCDQCQKWRKLPKYINPSNLPEKWFCSMNIWDSKHSSCNHDEESEEIIRNDSLDSTVAVSTARAKPGPKPKNKPKFSMSTSNSNTNLSSVTIVKDSASDLKEVDNVLDEPMTRPTLKRKVSNPYLTSPMNKRNTSSSSLTSSNIEVDKTDWVECCKCNKWRKVPSYINIVDLPDVWECSMNTWNSTYSKCSSKQENEDKVILDTSIAEMDNTTTQPIKKVIQWVQCERKSCQKWRKIPSYLKLSDLPEKWYCEYNTWDRDRSTCDAIEESDTENDIIDSKITTSTKSNKPSNSAVKTTTSTNNSLISVNSKSINTLSYRRLIFGTDGKVRPMYNEKSKTGYGLLTHNDNNKTINNIRRNHRLNYTFSIDSSSQSTNDQSILFKGRIIPNQNTSNDDDDNTNTTKRVPYWYSSHYNKNGLFYTSAIQLSKRGYYKYINKPNQSSILYNYDESDYSDSILTHLFPSNNNKNDLYMSKCISTVDTYDIDESDNDNNKNTNNLTNLSNNSNDISDEKVPILPLKSYNLLYPKKIINSFNIQEKINNLSIHEKHIMICGMIRSVFLYNEAMSLAIDIFYNLLKTIYYHNIYYNYYKHIITYNSFINSMKYLDDIGEVFVYTDIYGLSIVSYNTLVDLNKTLDNNHKITDYKDSKVVDNKIDGNIDNEMNLYDVLLPPKLRNKKYIATNM